MKRLALLSITILIVLVGARYYKSIQVHPKGPGIKPEYRIVVTPVPTATHKPLKTPAIQKRREIIKSPPMTSKKDIRGISESIQNPDAFIPMNEDGGILIGHATVFVEDEVIVSHGDLIVAELKDLTRIQESGEPFILPAPQYCLKEKFLFKFRLHFKERTKKGPSSKRLTSTQKRRL